MTPVIPFSPIWAVAYPETRTIAFSKWFMPEKQPPFEKEVTISIALGCSQLFVDPYFYEFLSSTVQATLDRIETNLSGHEVAYYKY